MGFWRFAEEQALGGLTVITPVFHHAPSWLAGLMAVLAGFALFPALARVRTARTPVSRRAWHLGGAITMSIGFWGTQNMALLSMELPAHYIYDPLFGFAALLPCAAGCAAAIHVLANPRPTPARLHAGAISLALGVAGMHYMLMEAIKGDVIIAYDAKLFALSLALGYGFSLLALYVNSALGRGPRLGLAGTLGGGLMLGITVLGNHFSAMSGTAFFDDPAVVSAGISMAPAATLPLVAGCVLFIIAAYWLGSVVDGRLAEASEAVRSSDARNRAVIDTMMDAHLVTDRNGKVHSFNPAAEHAFGWPASEILGKPVSLLINHSKPAPENDWARHSDRLIAQPADQRRWVYPEGGRRQDGRVFPIELVVSPFSVDGAVLFSCTVRDLSEHWEAESRIRRMATAIEYAGDAITILDAEHRIQYVNPQFERQRGCAREDVLGLQPDHGAGDIDTYQQIREAVERGETWTGQVRARRHDGSLIDEELTVTPVFDGGNRISGYVAVMRDITRRLEAERDRERLEALSRQRQQLEFMGQMADGIAGELSRPVQQLRKSLQQLGRTARGMDGLLGELGALALGNAPVAPAAVAGCLQNADSSFLRTEMTRTVAQASDDATRIAGIVDAMRDIAYSSPEKTRLDLNRAVQSAITVSGSEWHNVAEVRTSFDMALPPVICVAGDISLVVMNLLAQAAQAISATNKSGIRGKGIITVTTQGSDGHAEIRISHGGKALTQDARQALFDPASGERGMAMVHDVIVRRHDGSIAVDSDGRLGATFVIRLPLDAGNATGEASATAAA